MASGEGAGGAPGHCLGQVLSGHSAQPDDRCLSKCSSSLAVSRAACVTDAQIPCLPGLHPLQKLGLLRAGLCVWVLTLRWPPALAVSGGSSLPPSHGPETWLLVLASPDRDHSATFKPRGEAVALVPATLLRVRVDQTAREGTSLVLTGAHRTQSSGNILRAPSCHRAWLGPEKDPAL